MVIDRRDSIGSMPRLWLSKAAFFHSVRNIHPYLMEGVPTLPW